MIEENQVEGLKTWLAYFKSMGASQTVCLTFAPMYLPQIQEMYPNVTLRWTTSRNSSTPTTPPSDEARFRPSGEREPSDPVKTERDCRISP